MAFVVDENTGNITLVQGDTGTLILNGVPDDTNYTVYFAFYNDKRKTIGDEIATASSGNSVVTINIPSTLTDLLTVNKDDDYAEYYYGIKLCNTTNLQEDTLCINGGDIGSLNTVIVYPKKVEGIT